MGGEQKSVSLWFVIERWVCGVRGGEEERRKGEKRTCRKTQTGQYQKAYQTKQAGKHSDVVDGVDKLEDGEEEEAGEKRGGMVIGMNEAEGSFGVRIVGVVGDVGMRRGGIGSSRAGSSWTSWAGGIKRGERERRGRREWNGLLCHVPGISGVSLLSLLLVY